jgi:hypothetical protein
MTRYTAALVAFFIAGSASAQTQPPILGKWCDNTHQNGTRTLTIEKLDGSKVAARYKWNGPGPFDEAIAGTFADGRFKGGSTVRLNVKFNDSGNLVGFATRDQELPVTFKRCK